MTTPQDTPVKSPSAAGAESPTTVRPLDMDDDDVHDTSLGGDASGAATPSATTPKPAEHEAPPPKPPRPLSPQQQAENTLKEAFPSIDANVVKAVLVASGGRVEPAFNALLGMTDPGAAEAMPPPRPPRPTQVGSTPLSQLEADERYARQLAEHYDGSYQGRRDAPPPPPARQDGEEYSFIDDELPVIRENIRKGFLDTQTRVNGWLTNLKKRMDGLDEAAGTTGSPSGPRTGRRSGDYDADPQVLSDDFASMQLQEETPPPRPSRPLANPDLFKPTPKLPSETKQVSFQTPAAEEPDFYKTSPRMANREPAGGKPSKWQPLSTVEPSPIGDGEHDPFSLGDSEDEREAKSKEIKMEDGEELEKATAEAMADTIGGPASSDASKNKPTA